MAKEDLFDPGSVANEILLCLCRGEGQKQRQEPVAQDVVSGINRPGENSAPGNPISRGNSRLVQKEGKHRSQGAVQH